MHLLLFILFGRFLLDLCIPNPAVVRESYTTRLKNDRDCPKEMRRLAMQFSIFPIDRGFRQVFLGIAHPLSSGIHAVAAYPNIIGELLKQEYRDNVKIQYDNFASA